jgi:hypothetical protein
MGARRHIRLSPENPPFIRQEIEANVTDEPEDNSASPEIAENRAESPEYKTGYGKPPLEARKPTQFGGEKSPDLRQNIPGAPKPWSYRNIARHMSAQRISSKDPQAIQKLLSDEPTIAERITAAAITKASKGDMRAIEYLTDQVDGKVAQTNINADIAEIQNMTEEQLHEIIKKFNSQSENDSD